MLAVGRAARVDCLPFIGASRIPISARIQLADFTKGIRCRLELDIAVLASVQRNSELAKGRNGSDAIQRHSP